MLVLREDEGRVTWLTLNNPERLNAFSREMGDQLHGALGAAVEAGAGVVVITGSGRGFCAGADMRAQDRDYRAIDEHDLPWYETLAAFPLPVLAAVNGPCAGVGLVLAALCDLRFAAAGAKLAASFPRRGLVSELGLSWLLQRLVGSGVANDLLLTGRVILAEEAAGFGLVNAVVPAAELRERTSAYARDLAENCSPRSLSVIKRQLRLDWDRSFADSVADSLRRQQEALEADDFKEGVASFREKRAPRYPPLEPGGGRTPWT